MIEAGALAARHSSNPQAAGSLGTSKMTETRRDPHIGHFSRNSKLVSGNAPARVQISVCRSSSALPKAMLSKHLFQTRRRQQPPAWLKSKRSAFRKAMDCRR
jgi:hypothetical protein